MERSPAEGNNVQGCYQNFIRTTAGDIAQEECDLE